MAVGGVIRGRLASQTAGWVNQLRDRDVCLLLSSLCVLIGVLNLVTSPDVVGSSLVIIPVVLAALLLRPLTGRVVIAVAAVVELVTELARGTSSVHATAWVLLGVVALIGDRISVSRARLGVPGLRGESMLAELRDRLGQHEALAALPPGWQADLEVRAAGGSSFGGDFLVSALPSGTVELALVDVSGKGVDAATRALLLSGALGGLLGSVPAPQFLSAANEFLLRQRWTEGFATAVHLALDCQTGRFSVTSAGHPPAAVFSAGDGHWRLLESAGAALGLLEEQSYQPVAGQLRRGDALLLYTDGLIELPGRDLAVGTDKLLGEANRFVVNGFRGGAARLVAAMNATGTDDCGVLLLWRE